MKNALFALPLLFAVGCGVSEDKLLSEIDTDLWTKICDKATADSEAKTWECDGFTAEVDATTSAQCVTGSDVDYGDCTATFGDWKDCREASEDDYCTARENAGCKAIAACLTPPAAE